jgi:uncharacterized protein
MRVLCLEGSGSRAAIPTAVLAEIEHRTGRPVFDLFDAIVGVSMGAVVALMVAQPSRRTAEEIREILYRELPEAASARSVRSWLKTGSADRSALDKFLQRYLDPVPLRATLPRVAIPLYDLGAGELRVFETVRGGDGAHSARGDVPLPDLARAATSLPPLSEPARISDPGLSRSLSLIDGSVCIHPVTIALDLFAGTSSNDLTIVSLGDGRPRPTHADLDMRDADWPSLLVAIARDGGGEVVADMARRFVGPERFLRIAPSEEDDRRPTGRDEDEDPRALRDVARRLIAERRSDIDVLCSELSLRV